MPVYIWVNVRARNGSSEAVGTNRMIKTILARTSLFMTPFVERYDRRAFESRVESYCRCLKIDFAFMFKKNWISATFQILSCEKQENRPLNIWGSLFSSKNSIDNYI